MGIVKGILYNSSATVFQKVVRIAEQLLLVPFFLTQWGVAYYGEWLTLSIIPSVLALSDLGIGSAISNSFTLCYASGDKKTSASSIKNGLMVTTFALLLGLMITVVVMSCGNYWHLFDKSCVDYRSALLTVLFLMLARLVAFYNQMAEGFYRASRKAALGTFINSLHRVLNLIASAVCLLVGMTMVKLAFVLLLLALAFTPFYYLFGRRFVSFDGEKGCLDASLIKDMVKKGFGYMATPIWQSIYFQGSTFVVRVVIGVEAVAMFNTVRTVCRSVNQMYSIINGSIFPELQYEYGRGNMSVVRRVFSFSVRLSMVLGLLGGVFLAIFGLDLYGWWTKSMIDVPIDVWYVFLVGVFLNAVWWTAVVVYRMTNQPYHFAVASLLMSTVSVGMSYVLAQWCGMIGVVIGAVLFDLVMAIYVLRDSCSMLGISASTLFSVPKQDFLYFKQKYIRRLKGK